MSVRVALLVLLLTPGCTHAEEVVLPAKERFHLFVLAGQSNMAGRGKVEEADRTPHPRVLVLDKSGHWQPATDPLHFDKPGIVGVGLGKTFAETLAAADPDVTIGLVPCAVGGSGIDTWQPEGFHEQTKTHPWDDAIPRIERAMQDGTLKAILWHQGESDSNPAHAAAYEARLHALIARFRETLKSPQLPFLVGQLGQFEDRPWNDSRKTVDAAHRGLPKQVPHTAFVPSDGLTDKGDDTHFDSRSYREFGKRFAKAYVELTRPVTADR